MARTRSSPKVAVVGAGLGGIAAAYKLKKAGIAFGVFEQSDGPGGTWWDNTYPGCAVDVASMVYSYSFYPGYPWRRSHATQPELQQYCEDTIDHFGLRGHFRFSSKVTEVVWDEPDAMYDVRLDTGEHERFNIVVSALGLLNNPRYPDWPGLGDLRGAQCP